MNTMVAPNPLSEQDLVEIRAELSAGRRCTVWFTSAAVGVPVGGSARVMSVNEPAEGEFIQVKPARSADTMYCSPSELTRSRPPRKRVQEPPPEPEPAPVKRQPRRPAKPVSEPAQPVEVPPALPVEQPAPERPRPAGGRAASRPAAVTVTLVSSPDGEWTVEVLTGKKRTVRPTPVQPADIAKAARSLPADVATAIESSLEAARQRQLDRVESLRAELEAAQRALQELSS